MAQAGIRVMRNGVPVGGATVIIGENLKKFTTNDQGRVTRTVPEDWGPIAAQIIITGENFTMGGGPYKLERHVELLIEI